MSGFNIGIGALQDKYTHRKIRESLLGSSVLSRCPGLSNWCTSGLANQQAGRYSPATKLELIRFQPLPLGEIMWHLSTQVNGGIIAA